MTWLAVLVTVAGCFALKLTGWSLPSRWLEHERIVRASTLLPLALLAALVVVQAFGNGHALALDARAAGLAAGGVAALRRAPFIVVVLVAAATAALLRALSVYMG
jgi:hypothetical protein